jgi:phosphate transport system substrate-binding protein
MGFRARRFFAAAALLGAFALGGGVASAMDIAGAGSTFVYPVLAKWAADYAQKTGDHINYQSIGSGGGIAQIKAGTVEFGATDKPLAPATLASLGLVQFPIVIGGIVPVVNLAGIKAGELKMTGAVLASIYLGKITSWNDPALQRLNPGVTLPATKITVVHRSDGSGTTYNFATYLSQVSPEWKSRVGADTSVSWPAGVGGKGNEGVAAYVRQIKGAIGYVEYAYVVQNKMIDVLLRNAAGNYVEPSIASFQEAAASADWAKAHDFFLLMTDAPGRNAFPIAATTFILMHRKPKDPARGKATLAFFGWAWKTGQKSAQALDYVPLPSALVDRIEAYWKSEFQF